VRNLQLVWASGLRVETLSKVPHLGFCATDKALAGRTHATQKVREVDSATWVIHILAHEHHVFCRRAKRIDIPLVERLVDVPAQGGLSRKELVEPDSHLSKANFGRLLKLSLLPKSR
jgi:hypothetical protein